MKSATILAQALIAVAAGLLSSATSMSGATFYTADFNSPTDSAGWTMNYAPAANSALQSAQFGWDYSAFGIPAAPGASDTLGLRLRANLPIVSGNEVTTRPAGVQSGLSVSPTGQNFGTSYKLTFYAWVNFNGAPNASGLADNANSEGGTMNLMFAVGTSGTVPMVVGNTAATSGATIDGIGFATTGDGGIANDYRVYPKSGTISTIASGVYSAGANSSANAYYTALFPPVSAPAIQQTLSTAEYGSDAFNTQAGSTQAGAFGFAWHKVEITKNGNLINWTVDNTPLANIDVTSLGALGGNNIALGTSDVNTSTTRHPSLAFLLIDNLTVTDAPEPSVMALAGVGLVMLIGFGRRKR